MVPSLVCGLLCVDLSWECLNAVLLSKRDADGFLGAVGMVWCCPTVVRFKMLANGSSRAAQN